MEPFAFSGQKSDVSSAWRHPLAELAPDGIITMDAGGRILSFNPAAEKMFGYPRDKVIGRSVSETLIPPSLQTAHEAGLARFLATGRKEMIGQRIEISAMRSDQTIFDAELVVVSVNHDHGREPFFIGYIRDITRRKRIEEERERHAVNIKKTLMQTILAASRILQIRDPYTAGHQRRVAHLAAAIARELECDDECIDGVYLGALIHDIGKIALPHEILARPGKLLDEDISYLKIHCRKGYEILAPVKFPWPVAEIALQHHEHMDGSGYPLGLRDGEILLEARIVCVADVVESLTAHRPYRPAFTLEDALATVRKRAGQWYDSRVVRACSTLFKKGYNIDAIDMDAPWLPCHPWNNGPDHPDEPVGNENQEKEQNTGIRKKERKMVLIGNVLWFVFGGGIVAWFLWMLAGVLLAVTVIGLPFAVAAFRIAGFAAFPFGKVLVDARTVGEERIFGTGLANFLWILLAGLWLAISHALAAVSCCLTIIGIPFGLAHFKLAVVSFAPLGKRPVKS